MNTQAVTQHKRIRELDGLRGVAILMVVFWHYVADRFEISDPFPYGLVRSLGGIGWTGVDLFFILSGFLIGGILLEQRGAVNYFRIFYLRRFLRIVPAYGLLLVGYVAFRAIGVVALPHETHELLFANPTPLWSYPSFTQNLFMAGRPYFGSMWLSVTWSLSVEEQFYLLLPALVAVTPLRRLPRILVVGVVAAPILRVVLFLLTGSGMPDYVLLPCRMDALFLGVLCAWGMRTATLRDWIAQRARALRATTIAFLVGDLLMARLTFDHVWMISIGYTWVATSYALLLLGVIYSIFPGINRCLQSAFLMRMGVIAYGVYLFHQPISGLLHGLILKQIPMLNTPISVIVSAAAFMVTLLVAEASWRLIESYFVHIGHRYAYRTTTDNLEVLSSRTLK